jgi:hypothetical protein
MRYTNEYDMLPERAFLRGPNGQIMPQGGKSTKIEAPAPDPNIGLAQKQTSDLSKEYMDLWKTDIWPGMKQQAVDQQNLSEKQVGLNMESQRRQMEIADEQYKRYKTVFEPLQNDIVKQANEYDTEANRERIASQALGDVNSQFENQRQQTRMQGRAYGIDPTSGRYQGAENANSVMQAGTAAAASTRARDAAVQLGWAKKMDAIGLGSGIFSNQATSTGLALNAGNAALGAGQIPMSNYSGMTASGGSAFGTGMTGYNMAGQLGVQKYGTDVNAYNAQQQANASSSAGIGSAIGAIGGAAMKYAPAAIAALSDIRTKENIVLIGKTPAGHNLYEFDYKPEFKDKLLAGHGRFRGVMAQEIERVIPDAVFMTKDGYKAVDYSKVQ